MSEAGIEALWASLGLCDQAVYMALATLQCTRLLLPVAFLGTMLLWVCRGTVAATIGYAIQSTRSALRFRTDVRRRLGQFEGEEVTLVSNISKFSNVFARLQQQQLCMCKLCRVKYVFCLVCWWEHLTVILALAALAVSAIPQGAAYSLLRHAARDLVEIRPNSPKDEQLLTQASALWSWPMMQLALLWHTKLWTLTQLAAAYTFAGFSVSMWAEVRQRLEGWWAQRTLKRVLTAEANSDGATQDWSVARWALATASRESARSRVALINPDVLRLSLGLAYPSMLGCAELLRHSAPGLADTLWQPALFMADWWAGRASLSLDVIAVSMVALLIGWLVLYVVSYHQHEAALAEWQRQYDMLYTFALYQMQQMGMGFPSWTLGEALDKMAREMLREKEPTIRGIMWRKVIAQWTVGLGLLWGAVTLAWVYTPGYVGGVATMHGGALTGLTLERVHTAAAVNALAVELWSSGKLDAREVKQLASTGKATAEHFYKRAHAFAQAAQDTAALKERLRAADAQLQRVAQMAMSSGAVKSSTRRSGPPAPQSPIRTLLNAYQSFQQPDQAAPQQQQKQKLAQPEQPKSRVEYDFGRAEDATHWSQFFKCGILELLFAGAVMWAVRYWWKQRQASRLNGGKAKRTATRTGKQEPVQQQQQLAPRSKGASKPPPLAPSSSKKAQAGAPAKPALPPAAASPSCSSTSAAGTAQSSSGGAPSKTKKPTAKRIPDKAQPNAQQQKQPSVQAPPKRNSTDCGAVAAAPSRPQGPNPSSDAPSAAPAQGAATTSSRKGSKADTGATAAAAPAAAAATAAAPPEVGVHRHSAVSTDAAVTVTTTSAASASSKASKAAPAKASSSNSAAAAGSAKARAAPAPNTSHKGKPVVNWKDAQAQPASPPGLAAAKASMNKASEPDAALPRPAHEGPEAEHIMPDAAVIPTATAAPATAAEIQRRLNEEQLMRLNPAWSAMFKRWEAQSSIASNVPASASGSGAAAAAVAAQPPPAQQQGTRTAKLLPAVPIPVPVPLAGKQPAASIAAAPTPATTRPAAAPAAPQLKLQLPVPMPVPAAPPVPPSTHAPGRFGFFGPAATDGAQGADATLCVACKAAPRQFGFLHGLTVHCCLCGACVAGMDVGSPCPVCNTPAERIFKIF